MMSQALLISILFGFSHASAAFPRGQCGETGQKIRYGHNGGESQHVDLEDVKYVADVLRYISDNNQGPAKFWNMPKAIGDCAEWSLPVPDSGTVLALAKHISPRTNSSILYEDLARAIDGGASATPDEAKKALYGCGTNGGQMGVTANLSNPLYNTPDYKNSGAKPEGIIIKIVRAPAKK
ncbi:hypothetical protein NLG97_g5634 [Lecanicillium saksenae]|uniref:Uncharacterized protein n=1 Tax=Lecanicillium saksenae TaxID=468837 RepID=A0ACC1QS23_9HYPO|nr:hypothetical protein NLG97_g5634 [Lecanicillium saksenae]